MHPNTEKFNDRVTDIELKQVGKACAIARKQLGYTQAELAEKAGCQTHHLGNFEAGKQNISLRLFIAILGCLDMHIDLSLKNGDNPAGLPVVNKN